MLTFKELGILPPVLEAITELGYESPTPIQAASIPVLLEGRDLLGQAQTGTGKTAAFALPVLGKVELSERTPQVLVLTPTRELAIQVAEAFHSYAKKLKALHVLPIYGGQSMSTQLHQLKRGPQVVVGTPGRIMDHLRRESLDLSQIKHLILDEADEMLNMGFVEDIEWILEHTPLEKQIALFSATMPEPIKRVAKKYLRNHQEVKVERKTATVETIDQSYWLVSGLHKLDALTRILEVEEFDAGLIFVRTKTATLELAEKLEARGHACAALNGDLSQELRERIIQSVKNGTLDLIVATDVAARGLDIERISHVINYDIPHDPEAYVHRIGRTGRAGRAGKAILFVSPRERRLLKAIEKTTKHIVRPFSLPSKKDVSEKRIERFKAEISHTLQEQDLSVYAPIVQEMALSHDKPVLEIAAALCCLLRDGRPLYLEEGEAQENRAQESFDSEKSRDNRFREKRRSDREKPRRRHDDSHKRSFRIEVGTLHGVTPSNIVGAIANSIGIPGRDIGKVTLCDEYSVVDLPDDLPGEVLAFLENVKIKERKLCIRPIDETTFPQRRKSNQGKKAKSDRFVSPDKETPKKQARKKSSRDETPRSDFMKRKQKKISSKKQKSQNKTSKRS